MAAAGLRIGEVARRSGLSVRTLHHYDDIGLLVPQARTDGDHRLYTEQDLHRLLAIQHLKALGLGLSEVRAALDDPGFDATAALAGHVAAVEDQLRTLQDLLVRLRALQAAAGAGWDEVLAVIALTERLHHPDAMVRVRAALVSAERAPVALLLDQLTGETDDAVVATLTWAVAQHGADAVAPVCARATDPDPVVRVRMARVLAKVVDPEAVRTLVALLADPDDRVAAAAVLGLGALAHPSALGPLVARLVDLPDGRDAEDVIDALARFGAPAVDPLSVALAGAPAGARRHAVAALGALAASSAAPVLAEALADDDAEVRLAAVLALGRTPGEAAAAALTLAAHGDDARVRDVAARLVADRARNGGPDQPRPEQGRARRAISRPARALRSR